MLYGAEKSRYRRKIHLLLEEFKHIVPVLPLPEEAGRLYGKIRAYLEAKGTSIGNNDLWIAAHAKSAKLTLVTNNEREFKCIKGLKLQNWAKS